MRRKQQQSDAVWAAQLLVDGKVMIISPEALLAICRELVARAALDHPNDVTFRQVAR